MRMAVCCARSAARREQQARNVRADNQLHHQYRREKCPQRRADVARHGLLPGEEPDRKIAIRDRILSRQVVFDGAHLFLRFRQSGSGAETGDTKQIVIRAAEFGGRRSRNPKRAFVLPESDVETGGQNSLYGSRGAFDGQRFADNAEGRRAGWIARNARRCRYARDSRAHPADRGFPKSAGSRWSWTRPLVM